MNPVFESLKEFDVGEAEDPRHLISRRVLRVWGDIPLGTRMFSREQDILARGIRTSVPPLYFNSVSTFWIDNPNDES